MFKTLRALSCCVIVLLCLGCVSKNTKQLADLLDVKTHVAAAEFKAAKNAEDKLKVAEDYFYNAPEMTSVLNASVHNQQPAPLTTLTPTPAVNK